MLEHQRKTSRNIGKQENYNAQFVKFLLIQDHNIVAKKNVPNTLKCHDVIAQLLQF